MQVASSTLYALFAYPILRVRPARSFVTHSERRPSEWQIDIKNIQPISFGHRTEIDDG